MGEVVVEKVGEGEGGGGVRVYVCGSGRRGGRGLVVGWRGRCGEGDERRAGR